jgi:hypothetical protein
MISAVTRTKRGAAPSSVGLDAPLDPEGTGGTQRARGSERPHDGGRSPDG